MSWKVAKMLRPLEELIHSPNPACCAAKTRENPLGDVMTAQGDHAQRENSNYSRSACAGLPLLVPHLSLAKLFKWKLLLSNFNKTKLLYYWGCPGCPVFLVLQCPRFLVQSLQLALDGSKRKIPSGRHGRPALGSTKCF